MFYTHQQEIWDKAKCEKVAKHIEKDGLDTPYPFKGYIGCSTVPIQYGGYGRQKLNGGCVYNGVWYEGEERLLPQIDEEYEIVEIPSWGFRIKKKG